MRETELERMPKSSGWSLQWAVRSGSKSFFQRKITKTAKFLQQIQHNSRTDSPIDLGNEALDAHDRAGEDAERIGLESQMGGALRVKKCFFSETATKITKTAKFLQQIPHNSRTDSPIDLGSEALDARERAGEDAMLCDCVLATAATVLGKY